MAVNNFTLAGIAASVQFGLGLARLKATLSTQFQFRDAADATFAVVSAADAVVDDDLVTLRQLNAVSVGVSWKASVRLGDSANINVASAPATIDGVAPTIGDRVDLTGQTAPAENGLWVWNGAAVAMTRPLDWATGTNQSGSAFFVREGTFADLAFVATADPAIVDTDDPLIIEFASISVGVSSIASVDDGGGGGTFASLVKSGAAPVPTIRSISNGAQIAAVVSGAPSNEIDLSIVAGSVDTVDLADDAVTEPKLAPATAVLYRGVSFGFADFPAVPGAATLNLGAVLPTPALVHDGGVLVSTAFDNSPTMEVGVSATPAAVLAGGEIDLPTAGSYASSRMSNQDGLQLIATLTTNVLQPTAGVGQAWVRFTRLT